MIEFGKVWLNPHYISSIHLNDFKHLGQETEVSVKMNNGTEYNMQGAEQWWIDMFMTNVNDALSPPQVES